MRHPALAGRLWALAKTRMAPRLAARNSGRLTATLETVHRRIHAGLSGTMIAGRRKLSALRNMVHSEETLLAALHDEFERLNTVHFAGRLKCPRIEVSRRKTFGGYYQKHTHRIVLSWQAYREHGIDETLNTFRHEVAHIVHQGHDKAFWELAHRLGVVKKYAASPIKPRRRRVYVYACPACGAQLQRYRRFRAASCARCDPKYNPRFRLKLVHVSEPA